MLPGRAGCFVSYDGISTELREQLHLSGNPDAQQVQTSASDQPSLPPDDNSNMPITAVITLVVPGGYNGFAVSSLWEWLNLKAKA